MELGSGAGVRGTSHGPGGGWRALLADVRGEGHPLLAVLGTDAGDPPAALAERWCPVALDEAWRLSPDLGVGTRKAADADVRQVS